MELRHEPGIENAEDGCGAMTTHTLTVRWRDGHEVTGHLITDDPRRFLRALFCDPEVEFATATPIEGTA